MNFWAKKKNPLNPKQCMPAILCNSSSIWKYLCVNNPALGHCSSKKSQNVDVTGYFMRLSDVFALSFNTVWTDNFQMYKVDSEKAEEPEIKLPTSTGS